MEVRALVPSDIDAYERVRLRSLREDPAAFLSSPADHEAVPREEHLKRLAGGADGGNLMFGAFVGGALVGLAGVYRETRPKQRHTANIVAMYVAPEFRGRGAGRALLERAVAHAKTLPGVERLSLGVMETQTAARTLYERAGFVSWGLEPSAVIVDGRRLAEHHMVLLLR